MGFNLLSLMSYPLWTLLCAILFPILAAVTDFLCLRRARSHRKLLGFFITIPILIILIVIFPGDTGSIMTRLMLLLGLPYPAVLGFISAIALGILFLTVNALICGAGLMKKNAAIAVVTTAVICFTASAYLIYSTLLAYVRMSMPALATPIRIAEVLPGLASQGFIPTAILSSGVEMISLALLCIYLLVHFISVLSLRSAELLAKEELERRRRAMLDRKSNKHTAYREKDSEEQTDCCACCEHATRLKGDRLHMVCDKNGVVSSEHACRKFLYDPLKRNASRPLIEPPSESLGDLSGEDHI